MTKIRNVVMNHNSQKGSSVCSRSQIERIPDNDANHYDAASFKSHGSVADSPQIRHNQKASASSPKQSKPDLKLDIAAIE